jgi:hypothetical protein
MDQTVGTIMSFNQNESINLKFFKGAKRLSEIMAVKKKKN